MAFSLLIFVKITNDQQHFMQISYTKFYPDWTVNLEGVHINFIYAL